MPAEKSLVIVESPSKAKTIGKFLGNKYKVMASVGHVRDLPKSRLGIDIEKEFEPQYISIRGKGDIIKELKKEAKKANKVFLATDPDREGEAISWHIANLLGMDLDKKCRIEFNEITKSAVQNAIKNPRKIDLKLVDAQQARRVLDRLVGYQISPLLWRKLQRGLSAGRVQSAALRMICDRENQINAFIPDEYWNIIADLAIVSGEKSKDSNSFKAKLLKYKEEKIVVTNEKQAKNIEKDLKAGEYAVVKIEKKERKGNPYPPFTTSSLQQDAANKIGFSAKKTMMVAQQLYEGVEVPSKGTIGLLTYIRTDSVRISEEAREAVKEFINNNYGKNYYSGMVYKNKKKDVQDAHEAIRPSHIEIEPQTLQNVLTKDQYNLYKLVWNRFVASQMTPAVYDSTALDIENGDYLFRANGSILKFDGYLRVYNTAGTSEDKALPAMDEGEKLNLIKLELEQCFTQPPARYTEASLVKDLEEKEIGRPSTYAPIVATLAERKYIAREKKTIYPTELGFVVTDLMQTYFKEIVDVGFTADLEEKLDNIEFKDLNWKDVISDFYKILEVELKTADKEIEKVEIPDEPTGELCELCGKPMLKKMGRFGPFAACSGYPECKNTKPIVKKIGINCPKCGKEMVQKKSKNGKIFYGCSGYPACDQVFWNKPTDKKCPKCGAIMLESKNKNTKYACSNTKCGYKE